MPMTVTKQFLVDTDSVSEAFKLTEFENDKIETIAVGQIGPYRPQLQGVGQQLPVGPIKLATPPEPKK